MKIGVAGYLQPLWKALLGRKPAPLPFDRLFRLFRLVLEKNNRAIEIITDMGEKMGGDYLFDVQYLRTAYSELSDTVRDSLVHFDALTQGRYRKIDEAFGRMDALARSAIFEAAPSLNERVLYLKDISWDLSRDVGGKNAHLADLKNNLGIKVPEAFAITIPAFLDLLSHNGIDAKLAASDLAGGLSDEEAAKIRGLILNAEVPPSLAAEIEKALVKMRALHGENCRLSIRSSADEEDGDFSFAGQFDTVLNVPAEKQAVLDAYRKVVASLYSSRAIAYLKQPGLAGARPGMAVCCMLMIDAVASGVAYSTSPSGGSDTLMISSAWGLGAAVVDGQTDTDMHILRKGGKAEILESKIGRKEFMFAPVDADGVSRLSTAADLRDKPSLTEDQIRELAAAAIRIENYFRKPQDIEWAIDPEGRLWTLQARPLRAAEEAAPARRLPDPHASPVIFRDKGIVVQKGIACGRVFLLRKMEELDHIPHGSVIVSRYDSSNFIRVMPHASAIITAVGTPASHMASLCREFRLPAVVNTGDATSLLRHGQEVTIFAGDEGGITVYDGIIAGYTGLRAQTTMDDVYEFRKKRYVMRNISPLNLIDPIMDNFTVENCRTIHDILRFMHEKSVIELVERARYGGEMMVKKAAVRLDLPVPVDLIMIDIGEGLEAGIQKNAKKIPLESVKSAPLKAVVKGMLAPGAWHSGAVALNVNDLLSSVMRMPDITTGAADFVGYNVAVISDEYLNLSLKFGYHYTLIDCYCSGTPKNNHIYFRFSGGATDMTKRSRRITLLELILKEYGLNLTSKGDFLIARISNLPKADVENLLEKMGRLLSYTRQLDAVLNDDDSVGRYAEKFLSGNYQL